MIPNQPYVQQSAAMPDYYQQMQISPNQPVTQAEVETEETPKSQCHCCVDLSQLYDYHHMHDFHHMLAFHHYMHDLHHLHDLHHHMHDLHHMHDFHPDMHDDDDDDDDDDDEHYIHFDHYSHDGWEHTSIDYHHEWHHPMVHPHHVCLPVVCYPAGEKEQPR